MSALVTEDCPPRCPLSGSHRWPRASTSVEGPATMRVTQDLSGPAAGRRVGEGSGSGRRQFVRPTPSTTSAIAMARTTCGRQRRASRPPSPITACHEGTETSARPSWAEGAYRMTVDPVGVGRNRRNPIRGPSGRDSSCCTPLAPSGASRTDARRCPDQPRPSPRAAPPLSERNVRSLALIEAMATSSPRVSLVIPALNEARNLPHVFAQLPRDLYEVVLVDGNSRDGTVEVAKALWPGIRIVRQNRRGKGNALACGFAACRGDIIV